jgi:hypothetical protein
MQPAIPRAKVALEAAVFEKVPVASGMGVHGVSLLGVFLPLAYL